MNENDKKVFSKKIKEIKSTYPYWKFNTEDKTSMREMFDGLKSIDILLFCKSVDSLIKTSKFPPNISEILKRANELESQYIDVNTMGDIETVKRVRDHIVAKKGPDKRIKELNEVVKRLEGLKVANNA